MSISANAIFLKQLKFVTSYHMEVSSYPLNFETFNSSISKKKKRERRGIKASENQLHKHFYTSISRCMTSELINT